MPTMPVGPRRIDPTADTTTEEAIIGPTAAATPLDSWPDDVPPLDLPFRIPPGEHLAIELAPAEVDGEQE